MNVNDLHRVFFFFKYPFYCVIRWFVLDAETKDLVSIHTDGNEQLSVMRYSPGNLFCF